MEKHARNSRYLLGRFLEGGWGGEEEEKRKLNLSVCQGQLLPQLEGVEVRALQTRSEKGKLLAKGVLLLCCVQRSYLILVDFDLN